MGRYIERRSKAKKKKRIGMQHIMGHLCSYTYMSLANWQKIELATYKSLYIYVPILLHVLYVANSFFLHRGAFYYTYIGGLFLLYIYVPILLTTCPYTPTCVSSNSCVTRPASLGLHVSACYYICVLILLLYMCPHTTIYVSSYSCICVLCRSACITWPVYVFLAYICVLILLYMCPHTLGRICVLRHSAELIYNYSGFRPLYVSSY